MTITYFSFQQEPLLKYSKGGQNDYLIFLSTYVFLSRIFVVVLHNTTFSIVKTYYYKIYVLLQLLLLNFGRKYNKVHAIHR